MVGTLFAGARVDFGVPLAPLTTLRVGPVASRLITCTSTEQVVADLDDLGVSHQLPPAPWDPEPGQRSAREVLAHLIGETAQHAGHADIIRETIDGKKSMA